MKNLISIALTVLVMSSLAFAKTYNLDEVRKTATKEEQRDLVGMLQAIDLELIERNPKGTSLYKVKRVTMSK